MSDVLIELGGTRRLGVGRWQRIREANGAEVGDLAPHYVDNHAWQRTVPLDSTGRLLREMAERRPRRTVSRSLVRTCR